jgi:hypothetical protein
MTTGIYLLFLPGPPHTSATRLHTEGAGRTLYMLDPRRSRRCALLLPPGFRAGAPADAAAAGEGPAAGCTRRAAAGLTGLTRAPTRTYLFHLAPSCCAPGLLAGDGCAAGRTYLFHLPAFFRAAAAAAGAGEERPRSSKGRFSAACWAMLPVRAPAAGAVLAAMGGLALRACPAAAAATAAWLGVAAVAGLRHVMACLAATARTPVRCRLLPLLDLLYTRMRCCWLLALSNTLIVLLLGAGRRAGGFGRPTAGGRGCGCGCRLAACICSCGSGLLAACSMGCCCRLTAGGEGCCCGCSNRVPLDCSCLAPACSF